MPRPVKIPLRVIVGVLEGANLCDVEKAVEHPSDRSWRFQREIEGRKKEVEPQGFQQDPMDFKQDLRDFKQDPMDFRQDLRDFKQGLMEF